MTPPSDFDMQGDPKSLGKRPNLAVSVDLHTDITMSSWISTSSDSKSRPSVQTSQESRVDSRVSIDEIVRDQKKERYREKNRVAAAKSRIKKRNHTDHLEDDHRTQSALNTVLKQTERSLRDGHRA